ncbi:MAG: transcriptional regulator [Vicinamibacterales bacterium]
MTQQPSAVSYLFGPFRLDTGERRLVRASERLGLSERHLEILSLLVSQAGQTIPKEVLIDAAWKDVAVGDNSVEQAISSLRRVLGPMADGGPYIETVPRRGYRFCAPVSRAVARQSDSALDALLEPHLAFVEGRAAVETLARDQVDRARDAFARVVSASPDYAPGHVGLANALIMAFEASRASDTPDVPAVIEAGEHAREACRLDPRSGEAWATLAFVLSRSGVAGDAVAAARHATQLEPDNWRHHVRLSYVGWGEQRLRSAYRALQLLPGLGMAHWLAASVYVARQAFGEAEKELVAGTAAQDRQEAGARFGIVGLHLLLGLVHLVGGDAEAAESHFARELTFESAGHVYSREAVANAWCARGALALRAGDTSAAAHAFSQAVQGLPGHISSLAALSAMGGREDGDLVRPTLQSRIQRLKVLGAHVESAVVESIEDALAGRHVEAGQRVHAALLAAPPSSAGWTLPVEPLLNPTAHPVEWSRALATLRTRSG